MEANKLMPEENNVLMSLGRLEGKMDMLLGQHTANIAKFDNFDRRLIDAERRITTLETRSDEGKAHKSFLMSMAAIAITAASTLWKLITGVR